MPSIRKIVGTVAVGLVAVASALPAMPKMSNYERKVYDIVARQTATGLPAGLTDIDILNFALTLEFLEAAFYQQGFAKFPASDFQALGLSDQEISDLQNIGATEQSHVITLLSAIASAGTQPVAPCTYNFGFTDAAGMVATASILENVGVSAYLGAAPLITTPAILTVAAEIVTVEARHQTFIRLASKTTAVPSAFDTPLGIRNVFTLAAGFISSCPDGSNLAITPFPAITMSSPAASAVAIGVDIKLSTTASGANFCAFTNGGSPGGTVFVKFENGGCAVPEFVSGIVYLNMASSAPLTGVLTDDITVAGPMVLTVS
ncbi:ferritin-like domain-containing protein [Xylogone sp. PMI_703]|nr:ferritin-like domain-containing protein [Xylogone sp. PMI_703]